jgi:NAD(P)-dependent dehydrogenase (short-subunit alcohol dehydrogenase family)
MTTITTSPSQVLLGKVALITGGTSGIGRATAIALARAGAKVVVAGRRKDEGLQTVKLIEAARGNAIFAAADVTVADQVKNLVDRTVATYGRLDVAFNNAGIENSVMRPIAEQDDADVARVFDVNVKGVYLAMKHEIPAMLRSGGGAIVNTSSIAGQIGFPGAASYVASKHAVNGLTRSVALEYAKQGVRVNAVAPGAVQTDMLDRFTESVPRDMLTSLHPIGRIGTVQEIADAVVWLLSPQAGFVTGQVLAVDGGFTAQ